MKFLVKKDPKYKDKPYVYFVTGGWVAGRYYPRLSVMMNKSDAQRVADARNWAASKRIHITRKVRQAKKNG